MQIQTIFRISLLSAGIFQAFCAQAQTVAAQAEQEETAPVVVTANRLSQNPLTSLSDVSVITQAQIQASGASDLPGLLQRTLGVEASTQGPAGTTASLFIRGTHTSQAVVLVDGVRMTNLNFNQAAFQLIPLSQIERIEIVRGAASSVYGADAVGGVVQIFTKHPEEGFHGAVGAGIGNRSSGEANAAVWGKSGKFSYSATLSHEQTEGFSAQNPQGMNFNPDKDGYRNTAFSGSLAYEWLPGQTLTARVLTGQGKSEYDGYNPVTWATSKGQDTNAFAINQYSLESKNRLGSRVTSTLLLSQAEDNSDMFADGSPTRTAHINSRDRRALWTLDGDLGWGHWLAGAEYSHQSIDSDTAYAVTDRHNKAVFAGLDAHWQNWLAEANLRYDHTSQFGGATTGKIGLGYRITPQLTARASYATSFRAPTFNDLYWPFGGGNPNLKPEHGHNSEIGLYYQNGTTQAQAALFHNRINDMIALDSNWVPQNISQATITGLNLAARHSFGKVGVHGDVSWQNPHNDSTNTQLARRAELYGNLGVDYAPTDRLLLSANWHLSSHTFDDAANTRRLPGYGIVNVAARYQITPQWEMSLSGENIFNRRYSTAYGYNTTPASVMLRTRFAF